VTRDKRGVTMEPTPGKPRGAWRDWTVTVLVCVLLISGCVSQPVVTKTLYEDRSAWIRLETNPSAGKGVGEVSAHDLSPPSSAIMKALLKGFRADKDYNAGLISMAIGKTYFNDTFVEPELMVLAPQLAKGLAMASPGERVAYCLTADYSADERFITTGWVYLKKPYLYFKLVEWRTPVRVKSPATPTAEACLVKPIPGTKTADRFFQLDYEPKAHILTHGPMGKSIYDKRGEVVFKLATLDAAQLSGNTQQGHATTQNGSNSTGTAGQPAPATSSGSTEDKQTPPKARGEQPNSSKNKPHNRTNPQPF
jgi:hypothetical protein